jgi:DNA polymerase-3 subunit delta'
MSSPDWAMGPLPWQRDGWRRIDAMIEADRFPHALMVTGPSGIGKRHFLQALAARLLCEEAAAGTACGSCRACELLAAGTHADCMVVHTEEGARQIKVDQVRELAEFAARTPSLGRHKSILLGPAEAMNPNAANALLKCLEEPSPSTCFLLFSHQLSSVPATVRSRCQRIGLVPPAQAEALSWLERVTGERESAADLLEVCGLRPMEALTLFRTDGLGQRRALVEALRAVEKGTLNPLDFPGAVAELELETVFAQLQTYLEERVRARALGGERRLDTLLRYRDEVAGQRSAVSRGANPNRQLIIEDFATRLRTALGDPGS